MRASFLGSHYVAGEIVTGSGDTHESINPTAAFTEVGLPPDLFNVSHGGGAVGAALVRHPDVAKLSLTGEAGTGVRVMGGAAQDLKHITLKLGG